jgi:hypothetical protein
MTTARQMTFFFKTHIYDLLTFDTRLSFSQRSEVVEARATFYASLHLLAIKITNAT